MSRLLPSRPTSTPVCSGPPVSASPSPS